MKKFICLIAMPALLATAVSAQTNTFEEASSSRLQVSTRTNEERIEFLLQVATAYVKEKDFESAVNAYERILEIDPEHQQARYVIGHVYITAKQYAKAETQLMELVEDYPEDFKLKNNLAWLYATAEDPRFRDAKKAIQIAQEAMVLAPNDHHIWSTLSEAYYVGGEYEKAYRAITHMASLAARHGQGITKEAVEEYNEQIRKCKRAWDTQKMLQGEDPDEE